MKAANLLEQLEKPRAIYTDVDGTFVNDGCLFKSSAGYSFKNAGAMYRLISSNVDVVMTSGRAKENLVPAARLLGLQNFIANLGIEIVYNQGEKVLRNFGLGAKSASEQKAKIMEMGVADALLKKFDGSIRFYQPWEDMLTTHHLFIGEADNRELSDFIAQNFPLLRIIDNGHVPPRFGFSHPHTFHLTPKNVGKNAAVKIDKKERHLRRSQLIGIGDSMEDLSIAPEVGVFFLLGESTENVYENVLTIENEDGLGFSRIVEQLDRAGLLEAYAT